MLPIDLKAYEQQLAEDLLKDANFLKQAKVFEEQGKRKGKREGRREGKRENSIEIALNMLNESELSLEKIASYCRLPLTEVATLRSNGKIE
ncbi:MAG: hypothetical protein LBP92_08825 [Deltaproteobacteria bacterium]|jgi:predicted transposase YdaD|nr:hypothetical protein [Deltaproteobacteria bacterium]